MPTTISKKNFCKYILLVFFLVSIFPLHAFAHDTGTSIEQIEAGYFVDIGYGPASLTVGNQSQLDFSLYKATSDTIDPNNSTSARGEEIKFTGVWFRLEKDGRVLFAGLLGQPDFGRAGFSYQFDEVGQYNGYVRFIDGNENLVETNIVLNVAPDTYNRFSNSSSSPSSVLVLLAGLVVGFALHAMTRRKSGRKWPRINLVKLTKIKNRANSDHKEATSQYLKNSKLSILKQLAIGLLFAFLSYFITTVIISDQKTFDFSWFDRSKLTGDDSSSRSTSVAPSGNLAHVVLTESGFEPSEITIRKGTTVVFSTTVGRPFWPASNLHPTHEIYPEFDPQRPISPDETWSFTFNNVGSWNMHDHIRSYFTGVIHVVE